jgi:hypothetical protein
MASKDLLLHQPTHLQTFALELNYLRLLATGIGPVFYYTLKTE